MAKTWTVYELIAPSEQPNSLENRSDHAFAVTSRKFARFFTFTGGARAEKWKHVPANGEKRRKNDVAAPR